MYLRLNFFQIIIIVFMLCVLDSYTFMFCIYVNYILILFYNFILDYKFNKIEIYISLRKISYNTIVLYSIINLILMTSLK